MAETVRRAAVAGSWYPGTPERIVAEVEAYLGAARAQAPSGRLVGLVSPHAGLRYSGPVAAWGYSLLRGRAGITVVLVGPSHRAAFPGVSVVASGAFETPLGLVPIDEDLASRLLAADAGIRDLRSPQLQEHSLEMQLPFLQHLVADLRIVPLLMGTQCRDEVEALAGGLASALGGREALLLASSDLSHYHPAPVANRLDALVVGDVERFDGDALMDRLESAPDHACGGGPMVAVMKAARSLGADRATVLRYGDSGDAGERDKSHVVGYLSAAFTATE
jgi:MEMO1 family protein